MCKTVSRKHKDVLVSILFLGYSAYDDYSPSEVFSIRYPNILLTNKYIFCQDRKHSQ